MVQHLSWDDELDRRFNFHPATDVTGPLHDKARRIIRDAAEKLLEVLPVDGTSGREAALVLTKLEEAMFWANAGIARHS